MKQILCFDYKYKKKYFEQKLTCTEILRIFAKKHFKI